VELRSAVNGQWERVKRLDTVLCKGDRLRTSPNSRAALFIPSENLLRVDQNTTVSVHVEQDETVVEFFIDETTRTNACGAGYAISRFPRKFKINTPFSYAAVEGTEFLVALACTQATVSVFEGKVSLAQRAEQASRVVLGPGQSASVGPGQPPTVQVLVKPTDAVQWALYYPLLSIPDAAPDQPSIRLMSSAYRPTQTQPTAFTPLQEPSGQPTHPEWERFDRCIDYIWVSAGLTVLASGLCFDRPADDNPELWPSDHVGVWADLEVA
jgi:hypothetical protein